MFKLPHNCTHFTFQQGNAQNPSSQASTRTKNFQMYRLDLEKAEEPEIKLQTSVKSQKKKENFRKKICFISYSKVTVWITTNCGKFLKMGIPYHLTCLLRNLYVDQEAILRIRQRTDWFQIGKGVCQGCILSPCLFSLYTEYIM